jgi:hypothetical protein
MSTGIKHLSQSITPETAGVLWLTDEELNFESPGVYEFNYLLDGMLLKKLSQDQEKSKSNFYLGENFGSTIFIGHTIVKDRADISQMYNQISLAQPMIKEQSTIFVFNKSKNTANINLLKELSSRYKSYNFENLNI